MLWALSMWKGKQSSAPLQGVALDWRTDGISIVTGKKAEYVGTDAGRPVDVVVPVDVLFSVKEEAKSSAAGSGDVGELERKGMKQPSRKAREERGYVLGLH